MRKKTLLFFILFSIILIFFAIILIHSSIKHRLITSYKIKAEVINSTMNITKIGVSTDSNMLNFGRMIVNKTNTTKIINIQNPLSYKSILYLNVEGNATPFLIYPKKILINENSKKEVYIKYYAKRIGNYTGTLNVYLRYPKNKLAEWIMVKLYEKDYY